MKMRGGKGFDLQISPAVIFVQLSFDEKGSVVSGGRRSGCSAIVDSEARLRQSLN